jgi:uncharacterized protein DUF4276
LTKRIIIIGEGQTEQSFCNDVLQMHFNRMGISIENPVIKKNGGGIVHWNALKIQIERHLKQDKSAFVTTLIDYYGIHAHHEYPLWDKAERLADPNQKMDVIEKGMLAEIAPGISRRFLPYVQLHEFEGLLFSELAVYENSFEEDEFDDYDYLVETIRRYPNPELINKGPDTAPSKRLGRIIKNYYTENENLKVLYGSTLAHDIGLPKIRSKCPRFDSWITKLEKI